MNKTTKPLSIRFLITLFLVLLAVFTFIRWDSSAWLNTQIQQAASNAGYQLSYSDFNITGLTVRLQHVHIQQQQNSLNLDTLTISPSLSSLASGHLGVDIHVSWLGNPASLSVSTSNNLLNLSNIDAMIDISRIQNLNIPAQLSGLVRLQGDLVLQQNTGVPQSGKLQLTWSQAKAGLATPEFTLGDYMLNLNSTDTPNQPWQWRVSGGSGVTLNGSGTLTPTTPDPKQWLVHGLVDAAMDNTNPSLSMMMQSMMSSNKAKLRVSGSLGKPSVEVVR